MDFGADAHAQPPGLGRHRQGRPLPDEEEQDHRDRRLGHASIDAKTISSRGRRRLTDEITGDHIIIATGATTRLIPGTELSEHVVTYEEQILDRRAARAAS